MAHAEATSGGAPSTHEKQSVSRKRRLTKEQERLRRQGLRILARIIARHCLANPEAYTSGPVGHGKTTLIVDGKPAQQEDAA